MRSNMSGKSRGFTLLEVLVALGITAIIGVMAYGGLNAALATMEASEDQGKRLNEVNILFSILSRDLRQAIPRTVRDEYGTESELAFDAPEAENYLLQFSRAGWLNPHADTFRRSSMQRVRYAWEEEKLIRESWYVMDRTSESESVRVAIVEGIKDIKLRYLDEATSGGIMTPLGGKWRESWPHFNPAAGASSAPPTDKILPRAVEITMDVEGWGEIRRVFELPANET